MRLGQAVKDLRKSKGIKAKDFADMVGISKTALSNIEGDRCFPSKRTIDNVCQSLGVPVATLLVYSVTAEDVPPEKRAAFGVILNTLKEILI